MINALTNKTRRISIIECKESWHATRLIIFVKVEFPSLRVFPLIYIYIFILEKDFPSQTSEFQRIHHRIISNGAAGPRSNSGTVDTRFFTFTIASAPSSGWTTNERYPLETFFKERRAFSRKWHAAEAYKRAAQVSSLLEAVFNRSPWNYAA